MTRHEERLVSELRRLAAEFLNTVANPRSLITVTDCVLSKDGHRASILLSVLPTSEERAAVGFANRQVGELVRYVRTHLQAGHLPQLSFGLDEGERHRQKIDTLLHREQSAGDR